MSASLSYLHTQLLIFLEYLYEHVEKKSCLDYPECIE